VDYLSSFKSLHENASSFFDKISTKYVENMSCREGCSQCCYNDDFKINSWEAAVITDWFLNLTPQMKSIFYTLWTKEQTKGLDLKGKESSPCAFLYEERCSIYSARPGNCRAQGVPLLIEDDVEHCPLNFIDLKVPKEDWLDKNRLNKLSNFAQMTFQKHNESEYFLKDNMVLMSKLKSHLMGLL